MNRQPSELFGAEPFSAYFSWVAFSKDNVPENVVQFDDTFIGRVEHSGQIIPGTIKGNVCRFWWNAEWHSEENRFEVLIDNFGSAKAALQWVAPKLDDNQKTILPLWLEVCATVQGNDEKLLVIGRKLSTKEIIPITIESRNRKYDEGFIFYEGAEKDFEVLDTGKYNKMIAICPGKQ